MLLIETLKPRSRPLCIILCVTFRLVLHLFDCVCDPTLHLSLLPDPPVIIKSSFSIIMCVSLSLTLPETAQPLSLNPCDGDVFDVVIHGRPFLSHLSVSVCCTRSSRCPRPTSPTSSPLSFLLISRSHLIPTQSKRKTV